MVLIIITTKWVRQAARPSCNQAARFVLLWVAEFKNAITCFIIDFLKLFSCRGFNWLISRIQYKNRTGNRKVFVGGETWVFFASIFVTLILMCFNDIHMEELRLYWKNSFKYKVGCFWGFFICLHNQLSCFNSIIIPMSEKRDSSSRQ